MDYVMRRLEEIFNDMPFDLIFLEDNIRPEIREIIKKEVRQWKP